VDGKDEAITENPEPGMMEITYGYSRSGARTIVGFVP
jgi:hypothetical protein